MAYRYGVALQLLDVTLKYTVYGVGCEATVAFSQLLTFAHVGLLAKQFNGVQHKVWEALVPVYLEVDIITWLLCSHCLETLTCCSPM